jgi:hypothetical protein
MAGLDDIRNDLERLLKDVQAMRDQTAARPSPSPATEPEAPAEVADNVAGASALKELEDFLTSKAGEAEEAIEEHPLVAMAAAFLLGLTIGRFSPR